MYVVQLARVHGEPPVLESGEARSSGVKKKEEEEKSSGWTDVALQSVDVLGRRFTSEATDSLRRKRGDESGWGGGGGGGAGCRRTQVRLPGVGMQ